VAGLAVTPAAVALAEDADIADPGQVAEVKARQRETQTGKYGFEEGKPFKPPTEDEKKEELSWIEIELIGANNQPIPGEKYEIKLPDDSVAKGTLNNKGLACIKGIKSGNCKITFPDFDGNSWEKA
jgi:hypothetical protein